MSARVDFNEVDLDDVTDEDDDEMEAFENQIINTNTIREEGFNDTTVATDLNAVRRTIGDFEVLRLAKRGDVHSFFQFSEMSSINLRTFMDNMNRNALHYAADGGNLELIERLVRLGVPQAADSKGLHPADIARANGFSDAVVMALGGSKHTREEVLQHYAPKPPAFTISRPAPPAPAAGSRSRRFWSGSAADEDEDAQWSVQCRSGIDAEPAKVWGTLCGLYVPQAKGADAWSLPFGKDELVERAADLVVATAQSKAGGDSAGRVGQILCWKLGQDRENTATSSLHVDPNAQICSPSTLHSFAWVGGLAVEPVWHGKGVGAALMHHLRAEMKECLGVRHVAFAVPETPLAQPPASTCLIKMFRRSVEPMKALTSTAAQSLYGEYFDTDSALRVDSVLMESVTDPLRSRLQSALQKEWTVLDRSDEEGVRQLLNFIQKTHSPLKSGSAGSGFEVAYVPTTCAELQRSLLIPGTVTCVRRTTGAGPSSVCTDIVTLRRRVSPNADGDDTEGQVAEVMYALLPSFKPGPEKLEHLLLLAEQHAGANTLLVPGLFGITDSDATKCQFTECVSFRRLLYVIDLESKSATMKRAVPPSKVSIPLLF